MPEWSCLAFAEHWAKEAVSMVRIYSVCFNGKLDEANEVLGGRFHRESQRNPRLH